MIGELLEFTLACGSLPRTAEFYRSLGFLEAHTGAIVTEPYVALGNGEVGIGLYQRDYDAPALTFVRPNLKEHLRALRRHHIELEFAELEDDQFHRAGFRDPNGQLVILSEARTRSPLTDDPNAISIVGKFVEYSLPTHSVEVSASFWRRLGLGVSAEGGEPAPWIRLRGHGLTMGLHEGSRFLPGLCFECQDLEARIAYLEAKNCSIRRGVPFGYRGTAGAMISAPDNQAVYLVPS